jgi:uncharacterized protein YjbI with pentapeptide repeats
LSRESARDPPSVEPDGNDGVGNDGAYNSGADGRGEQPGVDATARLLLALTALYVQRSNHTAAEQRQYTELALGLIDKAAPAVRTTVAARLQRHPDAPAAVIGRLAAAQLPHMGADRGQPGAAPDAGAQDWGVQDLGAQDLHAEELHHFEADLFLGSDLFATFAGDELAGQELTDAMLTDAMLTDAILADAAPAGAELTSGDSGAASGSLSAASLPAPAPAPLTPEFGAAFFAASPAERRRILSEVAAPGAADADSESGRRFHVRIDVAPWHGRTGAFARDFARLIDAPASLCDRILNDPWGEPMVVAARATGMPVAILQRILLLVSLAAHHPVQRVYELTDLYHALDGRTARELLGVWRDAAADAAGDASGNAAGAENRLLPVPIQPAPGATDIRARLRALNARIENRGGR